MIEKFHHEHKSNDAVCKCKCSFRIIILFPFQFLLLSSELENVLFLFIIEGIAFVKKYKGNIGAYIVNVLRWQFALVVVFFIYLLLLFLGFLQSVPIYT